MKRNFVFISILLALLVPVLLNAQINLGMHNGSPEGRSITLKVTSSSNYQGLTMTGTYIIIRWLTTTQGVNVKPANFVVHNGFTAPDPIADNYPYYAVNGGYTYRLIQFTTAFTFNASWNQPSALNFLSFNMTGDAGTATIELANDAFAAQMVDDYAGGPGHGFYYSDIAANNITTVNQFSPRTLGGVPLPLTLLSFTANENNCKAKLDWSTTNEINTSHFDIEASDDGRSFRSIGRVEAQGNGTGRSYQFSTVQAAGNTFYRLKMVDLDGSFTYSPVRRLQVNCQLADQFTIWPNPTRGAGTLNASITTAYSGAAILQVISADGRVVNRRAVTLLAGANSFTLPVAAMPGGLYTLQAITPEGRSIGSVQKVIVNR